MAFDPGRTFLYYFHSRTRMFRSPLTLLGPWPPLGLDTINGKEFRPEAKLSITIHLSKYIVLRISSCTHLYNLRLDLLTIAGAVGNGTACGQVAVLGGNAFVNCEGTDSPYHKVPTQIEGDVLSFVFLRIVGCFSLLMFGRLGPKRGCGSGRHSHSHYFSISLYFGQSPNFSSR